MTAKEFLNKYDKREQAMIEFAKYHVKNAVNEIVNNAEAETNTWGDGYVSAYVVS